MNTQQKAFVDMEGVAGSIPAAPTKNNGFHVERCRGGKGLARRAGAVLLLLPVFAGCASWSPETRTLETTYQTLHAIDVAQTVAIARNPEDYAERNQAWLLGEHPKVGGVLAWGAANAVVHAAVTGWLEDREAPRWVRRTWQAVTIGEKAYNVGRNWSIGLRFGWGHRPRSGGDDLRTTQPVLCPGPGCR